MNTQAIKYGFYFLTILLFAGIGRAEQVNAADSEMQALRGQVAELQQQMKDANERHTEEIKLLREEIELLKHSNVAPPAAATVQARPVEPNQARCGCSEC